MSNYIDKLAIEIHQEAEPTDDPTEDMPLYRIYAVLMLAKGQQVTSRDVHDAWSAWSAEYDPDHRSLIPFRELPPAVQKLDERYRYAIRVVAKREFMRRWNEES